LPSCAPYPPCTLSLAACDVTPGRYSCKLGVTELNIASRRETVDSSRVAAMIALAQHMGVPFDAKDVKYVSWTSCPQLQRGVADDV
jgi:hypothetical protein